MKHFNSQEILLSPKIFLSQTFWQDDLQLAQLFQISFSYSDVINISYQSRHFSFSWMLSKQRVISFTLILHFHHCFNESPKWTSSRLFKFIQSFLETTLSPLKFSSKLGSISIYTFAAHAFTSAHDSSNMALLKQSLNIFDLETCLNHAH